MRTNKKNKGTKQSSKNTAKAEDATTQNPNEADQQSRKVPPSSTSGNDDTYDYSFLSQLNGLIFLCPAVWYLIEMARVAFQEGDDSAECSLYVRNVETCNSVDIAMIRVKFYSGSLTTLVVMSSMAVCWFDSGAFQRLNSLLCLTPLLATVVALQATRDWMIPSKQAEMGFLVTVLLGIAAVSFYRIPRMAPLRGPKLDLRYATSAMLIFIHLYDMIKLGMEGVEGLVTVQEDGVVTSSPAAVLIFFVIVDRATVVAILAFGILFLTDQQGRMLLLLFGMTQFLGQYYLLLYIAPPVQQILRDPMYHKNLLYGSGLFSVTASALPNLTLLGLLGGEVESTSSSSLNKAVGEGGERKITKVS